MTDSDHFAAEHWADFVRKVAAADQMSAMERHLSDGCQSCTKAHADWQSVCDVAASSYGMGTWNDACAPQTDSMTITAVVRNAATDHPSVEFQPALRFNPTKQVWLYMAVTNQATLDATKVLWYCNETSCMDESQTDADLKSYVDTKNFMVFRRIKHFSGYVVAEFSASPLSLDVSFGF